MNPFNRPPIPQTIPTDPHQLHPQHRIMTNPQPSQYVPVNQPIYPPQTTWQNPHAQDQYQRPFIPHFNPNLQNQNQPLQYPPQMHPQQQQQMGIMYPHGFSANSPLNMLTYASQPINSAPRANLSTTSSSAVSQKPGRSRGRPRKSRTKKAQASDSESSEVTTPTITSTRSRRRGRAPLEEDEDGSEVATSASQSSRKQRQANALSAAEAAKAVKKENGLMDLKVDDSPTIVGKDGVVYRVGTAVYLQSDNPQDVYFIGKILEFITDKTTNKVESFRAGWFYRPKDVIPNSKRKNWDARLLVASMQSDINPITAIRGKCVVTHAHFIPNLEKHKSLENTFYYKQLYDRYTHRLYDVIPTSLIKHFPSEINDFINNYEFILVEQGTKLEHIENRLHCKGCDGWVFINKLVRCSYCGDTYHRSCAGLEQKLKRGVKWKCSECIAGGVDSDSEDFEKGTKTVQFDPKVRKWPYFYFGDNSKLSDFEDGEGRPKCSSRIGALYQSSIPDLIEEEDKLGTSNETEMESYNLNTPETMSSKGKVTQRSSEDESFVSPKGRGRGWRGGLAKIDMNEVKNWNEYPASRASNSEIWYIPFKVTNTELNNYIEFVLNLLPSHVVNVPVLDPNTRKLSLADEAMNIKEEIINRALGELHRSEYDIEKSCAVFTNLINSREPESNLIDRLTKETNLSREDATLRIKVYNFLQINDWTMDDVERFEEVVESSGYDFATIKKKTLKTRAAIIWYFYKWKKTPRYAEVYGNFCAKYRPYKIFKSLKKTEPEQTQLATSQSQSLTSVTRSLSLIPRNSSTYLITQTSVTDQQAEHQPPLSRDCNNCGIIESTPVESWIHRLSVGPFSQENGGEEIKKFTGGFVSAIGTWNEPDILCWECAYYWLRYATIKFIPDSIRRKHKDRRGQNLKRTRDTDASSTTGFDTSDTEETSFLSERRPAVVPAVQSFTRKHEVVEESSDDEEEVEDEVYEISEEEDITNKIFQCAVCTGSGSVGIGSSGDGSVLVSCVRCKLKVHSVCFGIQEKEAGERFTCGRCENIMNPETSVIYECVLCNQPDIIEKRRESALIETIGKNWVHTECAIWYPEIKFGASNNRLIAECIGFVEKQSWNETCKLCGKKNGAVRNCDDTDCSEKFHIRCAKEAGFDFSIETEKSGSQSAKIYCSKHQKNSQPKFPAPALIQQFVRDFKQSEVKSSTIAQRRAHSIQLYTKCSCVIHSKIADQGADVNKNIKTESNDNLVVEGSISVVMDRSCLRCGLKYSPIWWSAKEAEGESEGGSVSDGSVVCHVCYWKIKGKSK
ncbi:putative PHD type zinc finger protein with BAH domain-containing protein [Nowakowskiella sp. JEL0407]|nr:putative PHD type zinc finger protein with BAH domain-containing protein [Nowakowskiella sp. JEL0407]